LTRINKNTPYDFAGIRYPPPLLQRRSSDTDYLGIIFGCILGNRACLAHQRERRGAASLARAFM